MKTNRHLISYLILLILLYNLTLLAQTDISPGYHIRHNDALDVSVFGNPDLHKNAIVPPDGIISFALIGEVYVIGLTARELEKALEQRYQNFLVNPVISISLGTFESTKVYIIGEINHPGPIPYDSTKTLADYLILSGGFTPAANLKKCLIIRSGAPDLREEINLKKFIKEGVRYEIPLYPDDTVFIPRRSPYVLVGWSEWSQFLNILLAGATLYLILRRE